MAKKKQAKGSKTGSGKIGKSLRKAGDSAGRLAQHPVVSDLVAAALVAAAASLADTKAGRKARRDAADLGEEALKESAAVGTAVKRALLDAARSLLDGFEEKMDGGAKRGGKGGNKQEPSKG